MPGTYRTEAIILGRTNFGEADRILTVLTPDHGKIRIIAKGSRKIKSRSGGHIELFGKVDLMLAHGRNMDVLTSARLLWYPHTISSSYDRLGHAYLMGTMINRLVDESEPHPEIFSLLYDGLIALNEVGPSHLLELWYKLRLLNELGYRPQLEYCLVCGQSEPDSSYFFSPDRGGLVDGSCRNPGDTTFPVNAIKLWRLIMSHPYNIILAISGGEQLAKASLSACDALYEFHLGRAFHPSVTFS